MKWWPFFFLATTLTVIELLATLYPQSKLLRITTVPLMIVASLITITITLVSDREHLKVLRAKHGN